MNNTKPGVTSQRDLKESHTKKYQAHPTPLLTVLAAETFVLHTTAEFYKSKLTQISRSDLPVTTDSQVTGGEAENHFLPSMAPQRRKEKTHIVTTCHPQN